MIPGLFLRKMWTWEGGFLAALEITGLVAARPYRAVAVSTWVVGDRASRLQEAAAQQQGGYQ